MIVSANEEVMDTVAKTPENAEQKTVFHDLDDYLGLRRQGTLALSPDGSMLVAEAAELEQKKNDWVNALWQIDLEGALPARRITRSSAGTRAAAFLPDGSLLFLAPRGPTAESGTRSEGEPQGLSLWKLSSDAGTEAEQLAVNQQGGFSALEVAAHSGDVILKASVLIGAAPAEAGVRTRQRAERDVSAILHDGYPARLRHRDIGPEQDRLFVTSDNGSVQLRDLTPDAEYGLLQTSFDVSRDGTFIVTSWQRIEREVEMTFELVRIETSTGARTVLAGAPGMLYGGPVLYYEVAPAISPDGSRVACVRLEQGTYERADVQSLCLVDTEGPREPVVVPLEGELRAKLLVWAPDGKTLYFVADQSGRAPIFALDVSSARLRRLVNDGSYSGLCVHPDGQLIYAVRSSWSDPGSVVVLDTGLIDQTPVELRGPAPVPQLPGTLSEVSVVVQDGTSVRAFLALPKEASREHPAPLLLWAHGGPVNSFNTWSWNWCPWLLTACGYAVLMPDPALSTGYGQEMLQRGWGEWGKAPFNDLMAVTDEALTREDLDSTRTAVMGASFGGYMANWIAGHTDRFKAITSHAGIWALDDFGESTDLPNFWRAEMERGRIVENSPHLHARKIVTPMLVTHGDKDYRVPVGQSMRLWWSLLAHHDVDEPLPHRFLYFPDESHRILRPRNQKIWYETVRAFLAWHVLDEGWNPPADSTL
ncbi:prolyl oligopeptidase family serine peptidase [Arthrobacter cryoconiti]|uniref:S9 family peptidase n=1 Tax=Arthrobacter cryoconiti TaxID=748907 RepID=A0ABV8R1U0_9MICC|nr:prolyl oligopeptidase family serine peptidase [Arthrobacter cryoconiti]MCC9069815.1 prolyl oligopeptidase family serine peptidase [Arthrobacter cryoconiti]